MEDLTNRYQRLKRIAMQQESPAMYVDLNAFDENAKKIIATAKNANLKLRPATKSIRVPELLRRIKNLAGDSLSGFMCYSCQEAQFLFEHFDLDNLLVAYPTLQKEELDAALTIYQSGGDITLMVDCKTQVSTINHFFADKNITAKLAIDIDMSLRYLKGAIHLGVRRSPVRTITDLNNLIESIANFEFVKLSGIMGYEAQVAGLPDHNPLSNRFINRAKQIIRKISVKKITKFRREIFEYCKSKNIELEFFNGGGTGSLSYAVHEPWLTEVTAGSGFFQSTLFDYYTNWQATAALFFSLPIVRMPDQGIYTCKSGGFVASGEAAIDKLPRPWLPKKGRLIKTEGCGEVQTPVCFPKTLALQMGDPVFFRPAKAGEIAEHFNHYYFIENDELIGSSKTYRGYGKVFY